MTAAPVTIVCANCGAKYKLPADFKAASAKCKGCGATIDVAGQMKAAAAPAKPAAPAKSAAPAAKPATAAAKPAASARAAREEPASSRRERAGSTSKRPSSRRGGEEGGAEKKKGSNAMAIGSLVGIAGLGIASYFIFFSGGDKPAATPTADAPAASSPADKPAPKPDESAAAAKAEADELAKSLKEEDTSAAKDEPAAKPADAAAKKGDEPAAKGELEKELQPEQKPAEKPAAKPPAKKGEEPKLTSMSEVFDAGSLPPLTYPDDIGEELRKEIDDLAEQIKNPGPSGRRAKRRLEEIGHPGMVGVINMYQKLDFKSSDQSTLQFDINKFLTNTYGAGVVSSSYRFVPPGEAITPDDANFNAKTVEAWRRFWTTYSDKEKWENFVKARKDKGGAEEAIK